MRSDVLAAPLVLASPTSGLKMCSNTAFCDLPSPELYGYAGVLPLLLEAFAASAPAAAATQEGADLCRSCLGLMPQCCRWPFAVHLFTDRVGAVKAVKAVAGTGIFYGTQHNAACAKENPDTCGCLRTCSAPSLCE